MNNIYTILDLIVDQNKGKMESKFRVVFLKSILAGIFIGIGGTAAVKVANKFLPTDGLGTIVSAFVFTIGFVLIITFGVQLFTSNSLMTLNVLNKKAKMIMVIKNWATVWFGNMIGTFLIGLLLVGAGAISDIEVSYLEHIIEKKTHFDFMSAVYLGIGCNMIIVLTVMLVNATNDYLAKIVVAVFGVMVFLLSGYEHVIANMYYFGIGILLDSVDVGTVFVSNLLPVTIGNLIGGAGVIPLLFFYTYKK